MPSPPNSLQLLAKSPADRLGSQKGVQEIKEHPWFADIDFEKLIKCKIDPPFKPPVSADPLDVSHFDTMFTSEEAIVSVVQGSAQKKIEKHSDDFKDFC